MIVWKLSSMKKDYVGNKMFIQNMIDQNHLEKERKKLLKKKPKE